MRISTLNLFLLSVIAILLFKYVNPNERGFDCNDKSICKPYYPMIIRMPYLLTFALIIPISFIIAIELKVGNNSDKALIYSKLKQFYLGIVLTFILVLFCKTYFGRLRPNSIEGICKARHYCESESAYVAHFVCNNSVPKLVKESRMSFYSGHSSVGTYSAFYIILYIYYRLNSKTNSILLIQFLVFIIGLIPGFTQGINYWHHWSDIMTGYTVGAVTAYLVIKHV